MIAALSQAVARRSGRERVLLALLLFLAVPVAAVFLAVLPLLEHRAEAGAALADAEAERAWYLGQQREIAALPDTRGPAPVAQPAPVGLGGIEARLIDAGLRAAVSRLSNAQGNSVTLEFGAVEFEALMRWLDSVEVEAGYRVRALQLVRGERDGLVEAELRLEPVP